MTERFLRLLLRAFPRDFHREFGDEMLELSMARARRAAASGHRLQFWMASLRDILESAIAERIPTKRPRLDPRRMKGSGNMDSLWKDLHYATRRLFQAPLFA